MSDNGQTSSANTIVIFGASGDLTQRKLIPALFNLCRKNRLPESLNIVGVSRTPLSHEEFRDKLRPGAQEFTGKTWDADSWAAFTQRVWYKAGDGKNREDVESLQAFLNELEDRPANRLYYLSTAPSLYIPVMLNLGALNMTKEDQGWRRIVIEKPFGYDLKTAQELNQAVHSVFDEHQVYRIDHYLGKETAQNLLFLRFANTIFEPVWNRNYVEYVQVTVTENVDVGRRGDYYDQAGVLRDMFQNHLLQLVALVAMEPPISFNADIVRNETIKVLNSIRPIALADTVRAQYEGYTQTPGVAQDSQTPTYAALKLFIDNWRWQGVPFYLRSGKALAGKDSEIVVRFRRPPHLMFDLPPGRQFEPNTLSICIQPNEGIHLKFEVKLPDSLRETRSVDMEFQYSDSFGDNAIPEAYERLLLDALNGDASLFVRSDGIESSWRLIDPILQGWQTPDAPPLEIYRRGTWGPHAANMLVGREGHQWRQGCGEG
jgi:glucose-6-phosphate 1-dehydrogenase